MKKHPWLTWRCHFFGHMPVEWNKAISYFGNCRRCGMVMRLDNPACKWWNTLWDRSKKP